MAFLKMLRIDNLVVIFTFKLFCDTIFHAIESFIKKFHKFYHISIQTAFTFLYKVKSYEFQKYHHLFDVSFTFLRVIFLGFRLVMEESSFGLDTHISNWSLSRYQNILRKTNEEFLEPDWFDTLNILNQFYNWKSEDKNYDKNIYTVENIWKIKLKSFCC